MIVLKRGDDLACVCDRCLKVTLGSFEYSALKVYDLQQVLLCQKCHAVVEQKPEGFMIKHAEHPPDGKAEEGPPA